MIPNITRGRDFHGLLRYLVGPGRANEHRAPHLVGGDVTVLPWAGQGRLDAGDARVLADRLATPLVARGAGPKAGAVWHCSLSIHADDGRLGDELWGRVATQFMVKMGWADPDTGVAGMPWLAIGHGASKAGNDHIHLVVSMVRDDGRIADTSNDYQRAQTACRQIEAELELTPLEGHRIGVGSRGIPAGELNKAARDGTVPARRRLTVAVRAAATMADTETEFIAALRAQQVRVAPYYAEGGGKVTGYRVRLTGEGQRWFGGGTLARDLTLPRLRQRWSAAGAADPAALAAWRGGDKSGAVPGPLSPAQIRQVLADLQLVTDTLRRFPPERLETWGQVSADLAGAFAAWAAATDGDTAARFAAACVAAGQLAQLHRRGLTGAPTRRTVTTGAARLAYQLGTAGQSAAAQALLLRQLVATLHALYEAAKALGQARTADRLAAVAQRDLAAVAAGITGDGPNGGSGGRTPGAAPEPDTAGLPPETALGIRLARPSRPVAGPIPPALGQTPAGRRPRPGPHQQPERGAQPEP